MTLVTELREARGDPNTTYRRLRELVGLSADRLEAVELLLAKTRPDSPPLARYTFPEEAEIEYGRQLRGDG